MKKLTIHNLKVDLLHQIQDILTNIGEAFITEENKNGSIPVIDIYCQENRILFIAGERALAANLYFRHGSLGINSTSVLKTPKKYRRKEL